ncbi:hypothetical protein [Streptosporangium subroseum]|nr:hypothetical protein OHB15_14025 [Streptosporangium subroseum]
MCGDELEEWVIAQGWPECALCHLYVMFDKSSLNPFPNAQEI